jgi:putative isomerase
MDQGTQYLGLLKNQIDITRVPFSDRGSRLLVYQHADKAGLYIKLAERLIRVEPGIESYLRRPPFIEDLCFVDEQGSALEFTTTTSPELIQFQTSVGNFCVAFRDQDTLVFGLPAHIIAGIRLCVRPTHWYATELGGVLKHVRNLNYSSTGEIVINQTKTDARGIMIEFIVKSAEDSSISLNISDTDGLPDSNLPFSAVLDAARERWENWFRSVPDVIEPYREKYAYAWWVMANNLISPSGCIQYEAMMPTKAFYVGVWLWDSALHAIAFRHIDPELAQNQIRAMLAHQLPDGMLPDAIFDEGIISEIDHPFQGRVTKPPIMAWAAWKIHKTHPDIQFLTEIYDPLVKCNDWWFNSNDDDKDGVVQYTHPYSSGLDDSPLWDYGMPVESPDINTYLIIEAGTMAKIADELDKPEESNYWRTKAEKLTRLMIDHLWDEKSGLFQATHEEKPIPVITPFNLYPLWTGQLPSGITKRLLAHLLDPASFWGRFGLPTVAFSDPAYNPQKMWRGPAWANINYFFVETLQRIGEYHLAAELRDRTLSLIAGQPGIWEYYNSQTGEPPASAAPAFGWSAAVFIDLALQASSEFQSRITA